MAPEGDHPQRIAKSNRPIDRALLKNGFSNFRLEILEYCSCEDVLKREQYYLDLYKPHYNIATIAVRKKIKKYNFFTFFSNYFRL
jgi:group I intron endonuclease